MFNYHNKTLNLLKKSGLNANKILDIGCNKGDWTKATKLVYPNAEYYLFDGENHNITTNENTKFYNVILSDNIKDVEWNFDGLSCGNSYYIENTDLFKKKCKTEKRKTNTLNNIFKNFDNNTIFDIVKLDTQGSELDILSGFDQFIENVQVIIIEIPFFGEYNKNSPNFYDYIEYMKKNNFIPFDISEVHNIGFINQIDIAFIKKDNNIINKFQRHLEIWNMK
jgi:FkbM family methyltransferase